MKKLLKHLGKGLALALKGLALCLHLLDTLLLKLADYLDKKSDEA